MDLFNSSAFDLRVNSLLSDWPVPGLAFAVLQNVTIASKAFGFANLEDEKSVTTDTLFDIASCSKSLTAASIALLIANNDVYPQVQWETPMYGLLGEDFVVSGNGYTENVTVEDILCHRTGLPSYDYATMGVHADYPDSPLSVTRSLRNFDVTAPIRSEFMYSNKMYIVATYLVEQMSGLLFADFLRKYIWSPLGMQSSFLQPSSAIDAGLEDRIATPYAWKEDSKSYKPLHLMEQPEAQGAGSIFTSANDHIKWIKAMMNQEPPITPGIYHGLLRPRIVEDPDDESDDRGQFISPMLYAAGWEKVNYHGYELIHHNGGTAGFGSFQFFMPELSFGGVAFGNSIWAPEVGTRLCLELIAEILNMSLPEFPKWSAVAEQMKDIEEQESRRLRQELCPGTDKAQAQKKPLSAYTGRYWNGGYRAINLEIVDRELFINGSDRSDPFTVTFEHMCQQTKYVATIHDYGGDDDEVAAEFRFANGKVTHMGIELEDELEQLIWFVKQDSAAQTEHGFALSDVGEQQKILAP